MNHCILPFNGFDANQIEEIASKLKIRRVHGDQAKISGLPMISFDDQVFGKPSIKVPWKDDLDRKAAVRTALCSAASMAIEGIKGEHFYINHDRLVEYAFRSIRKNGSVITQENEVTVRVPDLIVHFPVLGGDSPFRTVNFKAVTFTVDTLSQLISVGIATQNVAFNIEGEADYEMFKNGEEPTTMYK